MDTIELWARNGDAVREAMEQVLSVSQAQGVLDLLG